MVFSLHEKSFNCISQYCVTHLLTHSMVQSPSWEANRFAASQEIPRVSQNPKVHYRTHKCPPPVSILGQPNPVHIPTSHLLEIHPNIIHPSTPRSPQWSLYLPPKTTNDKTVNKISVVKRGLGLPHRVHITCVVLTSCLVSDQFCLTVKALWCAPQSNCFKHLPWIGPTYRLIQWRYSPTGLWPTERPPPVSEASANFCG